MANIDGKGGMDGVGGGGNLTSISSSSSSASAAAETAGSSLLYLTAADIWKIRFDDSIGRRVFVKDIIEVVVAAAYDVQRCFKKFVEEESRNSNNINSNVEGKSSSVASEEGSEAAAVTATSPTAIATKNSNFTSTATSAFASATSTPMEAYSASYITMRKLLAQKYPDVPIISPLKDDDSSSYVNYVDRQKSEFCFILSPLDGELDFVKLKKDGFCTSIGLCIKGFPSLGVLCTPHNMEIFCGVIDGIVEDVSEHSDQRSDNVANLTSVSNITPAAASSGINNLEEENVSTTFLDDNSKLKTFSFVLGIEENSSADATSTSSATSNSSSSSSPPQHTPSQYIEAATLMSISNRYNKNRSFISSPSPSPINSSINSTSNRNSDGNNSFNSTNSSLRIGVGHHRSTDEIDLFKSKIKDSSLIRLQVSSVQLRLLAVAMGIIDVYPQFSITNECQTCAGHALILSCGGEVLFLSKVDDSVQEGQSFPSSPQLITLSYNKKEIVNPQFFAYGRLFKQDNVQTSSSEFDNSDYSSSSSSSSSNNNNNNHYYNYKSSTAAPGDSSGDINRQAAVGVGKETGSSNIWLNVTVSLLVLALAVFFNFFETLWRKLI